MEKIVKKIEDIENPIDNIFKDNVDKKKRSIGLIHRAYLTQIKNSRKYLASTKTKSEVRGGGKKPWKQKGTGNARAGSSRSPLWKGGGTVFGPEPHSYNHKLSKKMSRLARKSVLSKKINDGHLLVLEKVFIDSHRTSNFISLLNNLNISGKKTLVLVDSFQENLILASRNIRSVFVENAKNVSVYDLMDSEVILSDKNSFQILYEVLV